jgi:hypothetical protein
LRIGNAPRLEIGDLGYLVRALDFGGLVNERIDTIRNEFDRRGYELIVEPSTRGADRGGWLARYRSATDSSAADGIAHGNTELEAAEVALSRMRGRWPR